MAKADITNEAVSLMVPNFSIKDRLKSLQVRFNNLPGKVQIAIYVGLSVILSMLAVDVAELGRVGEYLVVPLTVLTNIIAYAKMNIDEEE